MRKEDYFKTSRLLGTDRLTPEQTQDLLGVSATDISGDTGFFLGLEFFKLGIPIIPIPRYETYKLNHVPDALETLKQWREGKEQIFEGGYFHLQNTGNTLCRYFNEDWSVLGPWDAKFHEVRLAWYYLMLQLDDFSFDHRYWEMYYRLIEKTQCDKNRVEEIASIFKNLLFGKNIK